MNSCLIWLRISLLFAHRMCIEAFLGVWEYLWNPMRIYFWILQLWLNISNFNVLSNKSLNLRRTKNATISPVLNVLRLAMLSLLLCPLLTDHHHMLTIAMLLKLPQRIFSSVTHQRKPIRDSGWLSLLFLFHLVIIFGQPKKFKTLLLRLSNIFISRCVKISF